MAECMYFYVEKKKKEKGNEGRIPKVNDIQTPKNRHIPIEQVHISTDIDQSI